MPYMYYTADDGSTHLCHTDDLEHGIFSKAKSGIKNAGKSFKENWKTGAGIIVNKANETSVKVTAAAIDKTVNLVCKELDFAITTNEKAIIRTAANQAIKDLKDEGSLYKFIKKEVMRLRDLRQKTQDTAIKIYKNVDTTYNMANQLYNDYETLSPAAKKQAMATYKYAKKTTKRYFS